MWSPMSAPQSSLLGGNDCHSSLHASEDFKKNFAAGHFGAEKPAVFFEHDIIRVDKKNKKTGLFNGKTDLK